MVIGTRLDRLGADATVNNIIRSACATARSFRKSRQGDLIFFSQILSVRNEGRHEITYLFGDILTEVYGYAIARSVLWKVMFASVSAGIVYQLAVYLPPAPGFDPASNAAYSRVLGSVPRILAGGWLAVFSGEIANNYTLAKMKILTSGRFLWTRTVGSTVVGQLINTTVFYVIGLYGVIPTEILLESILVGWVIKSLVEILATPLTYLVVGFLKREENEDYYDINTDFNPFIVTTSVRSESPSNTVH